MTLKGSWSAGARKSLIWVAWSQLRSWLSQNWVSGTQNQSKVARCGNAREDKCDGFPSSHPCLDEIFPYKPFLGIPHGHGNPRIVCDRGSGPPGGWTSNDRSYTPKRCLKIVGFCKMLGMIGSRQVLVFLLKYHDQLPARWVTRWYC